MLQVRNERPPITPNIPRELVDIIERCWHPMPQKRPLFQELKSTFADLAKVRARSLPALSASLPPLPPLPPLHPRLLRFLVSVCFPWKCRVVCVEGTGTHQHTGVCKSGRLTPTHLVTCKWRTLSLANGRGCRKISRHNNSKARNTWHPPPHKWRQRAARAPIWLNRRCLPHSLVSSSTTCSNSSSSSSNSSVLRGRAWRLRTRARPSRCACARARASVGTYILSCTDPTLLCNLSTPR
jgi:hypothetical protein